MKRFTVLLLVFSLLIGAVAMVAAQDEDVYYMVGGNLGHPWWKQHFEGIEVAAEWLGINVEIVGPPPTDGIAWSRSSCSKKSSPSRIQPAL